MYPANMKQFKKPDLNAPRFRPKKTSILNKNFHKRFIEKNPKFSHIQMEDIKNIINSFNGQIWNTVIQNRDGVELPESLGYLFIGSTKVKHKKLLVDYKKSGDLGYLVEHKNWESDSYIGKICYSNCESKYKFANYNLWGFSGTRNFTRTVSVEYPKSWKKYHMLIDKSLNTSKLLFRKARVKEYFDKKREMDINNYNEFDFS